MVGEFGPDGDVRLKIRIAAPPVDGAANEELLRFVREITGLPSAAVRLVRGETSRAKDVRISGLSVDRAVALFRPK